MTFNATQFVLLNIEIPKKINLWYSQKYNKTLFISNFLSLCYTYNLTSLCYKLNLPSVLN